MKHKSFLTLFRTGGKKAPYYSFFHMKITVSVTKSLYQVCGLSYLHLPIFFLYINSPLLLEKAVVIAVFLSRMDHRPLFNDVYYESTLV